MSEETKQVIVSSDFIDIFKNFNVLDQVKMMKKLTKRELYLLLVLCLDKHDDENIIVKHNFQPFKKEVMSIYNIQDDKKTSNKTLLSLIEETGDSYIETDNIVDESGNELPKPFTKEEIREIKIDLIKTQNSK